MSIQAAWSVSVDGKEFWLKAQRAWIRVFEDRSILKGRDVEVTSNNDVLYELARCKRGEGVVVLFATEPSADLADPRYYLYV